MRVLVTGGSGFVGRAVLERLALDRALEVRATVRRPVDSPIAGVRYAAVADLDGDTDWDAAIDGCDVVVHTAARVHVMRDTAANPLAEFRRVNVQGTLNLARRGLERGTRRFVFVSSIKVNGEETTSRPYQPDDSPAPRDAYGVSKLEAEQGLRALFHGTGAEWVIVRPPLVYGPNVKGNLLRLIHWVRRGMPLPFGAVHNRRSLVGLENLASLIHACSLEPRAANEVFLAADGEDLSTPELLAHIGSALGRRARLFNVPPRLLEIAAAAVGGGSLAQRLLGDLRVDASKARRVLDWVPRVELREGLRRAVVATMKGDFR